MERIAAYWREREAALLAEGRAAGLLSAPTSLGRARESSLLRFLAEHLPGRVTIERGELIDSHGGSTGETDGILVDHESAALRIGGESIVPVEASAGMIEVKTTLAGDELRRAIEKVARLKTLRRTQHHGFYGVHEEGNYRVKIPPPAPSGYVIAYDGPSWDHIERRIAENPTWCRGDFLQYGPEMLCILGRGFIYKNDNVVFAIPPELDDRHGVRREDRVSLQALTHHVQETLARFGSLTYELTPYG